MDCGMDTLLARIRNSFHELQVKNYFQNGILAKLDILLFWSTSFKEQPSGFSRQWEGMMKFFHRKGKAIKKWHSRAMLIDLRKTRITIINTGELKTST
jgi:hypothetical protein